MSVAFDVVFGVFVALILVLAVVAVRWAVRRDRAARAAGRGATVHAPVAPPPEGPA